MRRYTKPAVVVTALGALSLAVLGSGAAVAAGTADGSTGPGSPSRVTAESASWNHGITQVNKRIVQRYTSEYLPGRDPALASKFVSPDIVVHFGGQTWQGRDTYLGIVAANLKAFPDLKWTVQDMRAEGDTVAVRYTMTGTHKGPFAGVEVTGKAIRSESMAFYRLSHGLIVEERAQLDMLGILRQMGAIPTA
ncbi:ester cyclase [Actinomadura sp. 6N118]|uniref:ester cyclase n=1 Tax=Actinomadura sp. 6N118 TaxID=3375151 RepID=UPI00379D478B